MTYDSNDPLPVRMLKAPVKEGIGKYRLETPLYTNKECGWICPKCNTPMVVTPLRTGSQYFTCEVCNAKIYAMVNEPGEDFTFSLPKKPKPQKPATDQPSPEPLDQPAPQSANVVNQGPTPPAHGMLLDFDDIPQADNPQNDYVPPVSPQPTPNHPNAVITPPPTPRQDEAGEATVVAPHPASPAQAGASRLSTGSLHWGNIFSRKKFQLPEGSTIIGRSDPQYPSNVQFSDPEMSRRSIRIDAIPSPKGGYTFQLTVLKCTNPVLVNNMPIAPNTTVQLRGHVGITLGRTVINFKER